MKMRCRCSEMLMHAWPVPHRDDLETPHGTALLDDRDASVTRYLGTQTAVCVNTRTSKTIIYRSPLHTICYVLLLSVDT